MPYSSWRDSPKTLSPQQKENHRLWGQLCWATIKHEKLMSVLDETTIKNIRLQEDNLKLKKSLMFKLFSCFN